MKYENIKRESQIYSYWGHRIFSGDVVILKNLYGRTWKERPVLIKMFCQLLNLLTTAEFENDIKEVYSPEFLYYWAMVAIGELSSLIHKDLGTAIFCLKKIRHTVPKAEARLAYVELLKSDEPAKSEMNVERLDVLRRWAGRGDIFSSIVLAKITFYQFLLEYQADNPEMTDLFELPVRTLRLLDSPCQKGHPVAIRFYNAVIEWVGTPDALGMHIDESCIITESLFDFDTATNMQIGF